MDDDLRRLERAAADGDVTAGVGLARRLALAGRRAEAVLRLLARAEAPEARALLGELEVRGEDGSPPLERPAVRWRVDLGRGRARSLHAAGAAIVVLEHGDPSRATSFDPRDGRRLHERTWREELTALEVVGDQVLTTTGAGLVTTFDPWTGSDGWRGSLGRWPARVWPGEGRVAVLDFEGGGDLHRLAAGPWPVEARLRLDGPPARPMALAAWGLLLLEGPPWAVRVHDLETGAVRWRAEVGAARAVADARGVVLEPRGGGLELRDPDGRRRWRVDLASSWLALGAREVLAASYARVEAVDRGHGGRRLVHSGPTEPPLTIAGSTVVLFEPGNDPSDRPRPRRAADDDAVPRDPRAWRRPRLHAVEGATGRLLWSRDLPEGGLQVVPLGDALHVLGERELVTLAPRAAESRHT